MNNDSTKYPYIIPYIAVLITVILWLAAPIFHPQRLWGIDHLSYFPAIWSLIYIAVLIYYLFLFLAKFASRRSLILNQVFQFGGNRFPSG